jgi:hypothetical protein
MPTFQSELKKAFLENLQSDPASGSIGRFWIRTDTTPVAIRFWNGAAVREVVTTTDAQAITGKTRLEVVKGTANIATGYGLIRMATVTTDDTTKEGALSSGSYDSDEEDLCALYTKADGTQADVFVGGGVDKLNAAKRIRFFAAADLTTVTGTEVAQVLSTGFRFILATTYVGLASAPSNPSAGEFKYYVKTDGYAYLLDSNGVERRIGVGADAGINYILNPDAETGVTGWSAYADAAAAIPVNGTGGSPTLAIARNTSSPLRGAAQFRITKDAANRQGEGVSYDFTIDAADKSKSFNIAFDYLGSTNFVGGSSSDVRVWIYDVTNSVLIQPAGYTLQGAPGIPHRHVATFQSVSNSVSYRLILHVATTNASAWTLDIDRVQVGPQDKVYGVPVTDWTAFTPTSTWSTNVTHTGMYRRIGDSAEIEIKIAASGATTSAALSLNMPTGLVIDQAKVIAQGVDSLLGLGIFNDASVGQVQLAVRYNSTTVMDVVFLSVTSGTATDNYSGFSNTSPATIANGDSVHLTIKVPILGWSSDVQLSSSAETRIVAARYSTNVGQTIADGSDVLIDFEDLGMDTHGAVSVGASWKFVAPTPGVYSVKAGVQLGSGADWDDGDAFALSLYKNGIKVSTMGRTPIVANSSGIAVSALGSDDIYLNAGDYIDVRANQNSGSSKTLSGTATDNYIAIHKVSGPAQVAASETVIARCTSSTGFALPSGAETIIGFNASTFDSHGAITLGAAFRFTAPVSGKYEVTVSVLISGDSDFEAGEEAFLSIYKNGTRYNYMANYEHIATVVANVQLAGSDIVQLNAGDYINVQLFHNFDNTENLFNNAEQNWITIKKVAN